MARNQLIQLRRDTKSNWDSVDPVIENGEPVYDETNGTLKVGDGSTNYTKLPTFTPDRTTVGIEWDTSSTSPSLSHIDVNGKPISLSESFFDNHAIWGNMWRCVVDSNGDITYGDNPRGDGLDLTGASGNVMVELSRLYVRAEFDGDIRRWWCSPMPLNGFEVHPAFVTRGGISKPYIYLSAYEASGFLDGTFKLQSATGKQPVTGDVAYPDLPNSGRFTIDDAENYANNIGSGYGCWNIWTYSLVRLLFYTEMASFYSQDVLGKGIVDKDSGTDFAGENTGADSADTNISTNGTGTGTGSDGYTPVVYRGIENPWGNVWQFVIGYNAVDSEYRITPRDGTGTLEGDLVDYESSTSTPLTDGDGDSDGYQIDVHAEDLLQYLMIGSVTGGSSSTYLCDYMWIHDSGETNILRSGGNWAGGSRTGLGYLASNGVSSASGRGFGARFEFIP